MTDDREFEEAIASLVGSGAEWLWGDDIGLWAYHGLGIMLNDAQVEACDALINWPQGTIHVWRWANRTGKTTGDMIVEMHAGWRKRFFQSLVPSEWLGYRYRVLHAAPTNRLMGRAWQLTKDVSELKALDHQRSPITHRMRKAMLAPLFNAETGNLPDGSEGLWVSCANGSVIDYLSTHDGAGRMESEAWWLEVWDEFARHQPASDVPLLIDQTFVPRAVDHNAPIILSSTSTEDFDPYYREVEELAKRSPKYWNFMSFDRSANQFANKAGTERQIAVAFNPESVQRSVQGGVGEGGRGPFPHFLLRNAFRDEYPERWPAARIDRNRVAVYQMFDHALSGDDNVVTTVGVPLPMTESNLLANPIVGLDIQFRRSSRSLTPDEQFSFIEQQSDRYEPRGIIIDSTAEGGLMVSRQAISRGMPAIECMFTSRSHVKGVSTKEYAIQSLQRMLAWGLGLDTDENGWITEWPEEVPRDKPFGLLRFPNTGPWAKLRLQLATFKRNDKDLRQDAAITLIMFAWFIYREIRLVDTADLQRYSPLARRRRSIHGRRHASLPGARRR